jgi:hypothetical protein
MEPAPVVRLPTRALQDASTLTFLFTDVEGSTSLWERHETLMRQVVVRHDALLDAIISQHQGARVKDRGEGDSIFATFADPAAAAAAALAINQAMLAERWPAETPIAVRTGLLLLSPRATRHNLPQALPSLVGREAEQEEVLALLGTERLVTLTGTGGVGKTRLALALAAELVDQYQDGVWLVELAALAEAGLVPAAVATALGVREEPGRSLQAALADSLQEKRLLLVLDNCEHLVAACAQLVSSLLHSCPQLRVLATSREGLEVEGERKYRVPSLRAPDPSDLPPLKLMGRYEAVQLFVARAQQRPGAPGRSARLRAHHFGRPLGTRRRLLVGLGGRAGTAT